MVRRVFFSFHFANDYWRTQQVRNIGALEAQSLCTPNQWEEVKRKGDAAVEKMDRRQYIRQVLRHRACGCRNLCASLGYPRDREGMGCR